MAFNFNTISPFLGATGQALLDLDADKNGAEDFAGALLVYAAEVGAAVSEGADLPPFPDELKIGTTDRITGSFKATLIVVNSILTVARFQVKGKAATALKYVTQTISQLIAGQPVPTPAAAILNLLK